MISKLSDVKLSMLAWLPMPPNGPRPPDDCWCLFSNGREFVVGIFNRDRVSTKIGPDVALSSLTHWAKLNNLSTLFATGEHPSRNGPYKNGGIVPPGAPA